MLREIVAATRRALARRQAQLPLAYLEKAVAAQPPPRDLVPALKGKGMRLIAEIKRVSPLKGALNPEVQPAHWARLYIEGGAAAISVLTQEEHFQGSLADLKAVRREVDVPLLCKDFILDPYQVYEARASGADAVLLIPKILDRKTLGTLVATARSLGLVPLIEVHTLQELQEALELEPRIVGINNRDLDNFQVDLNTTLELCPQIPRGTVTVSESGIHSREDVLLLEQAGINAILVGEALMTSGDPKAKIAELLGIGS